MKDVRIDGLDNLNRDFKRLAKGFDSKTVEKAALEAAEIIRAEAEKNAPRGPTGRLKEAQITKSLKRSDTIASAIAGVDRVKAPHAHLVEKGTSHMPAQPYFRPAVLSKGAAAARKFEDELKRMVNQAVR